MAALRITSLLAQASPAYNIMVVSVPRVFIHHLVTKDLTEQVVEAATLAEARGHLLVVTKDLEAAEAVIFEAASRVLLSTRLPVAQAVTRHTLHPMVIQRIQVQLTGTFPMQG
jgi:hypothetical protein